MIQESFNLLAYHNSREDLHKFILSYKSFVLFFRFSLKQIANKICFFIKSYYFYEYQKFYRILDNIHFDIFGIFEIFEFFGIFGGFEIFGSLEIFGIYGN